MSGNGAAAGRRETSGARTDAEMRADIVLLSRSLAFGGAERQIVLLAEGLSARGISVAVVVFYGDGGFEDRLRDAGIPVHSVEKRGRWDLFGFTGRLVGQLRALEPRVLYSFLPIPNLVALGLRSLVGGPALVWGVRDSDRDLDKYDWLTRWSYRLEARLASRPELVIANSRAGREHALSHGFPASRTEVVRNGIDVTRFRRDPDAGRRMRCELGLEENALVIGRVGRIEPMKDYPTFLRAIASLKPSFPGLRVLCIGGESDAGYTAELHQLTAELGIQDLVRWTGRLSHMVAAYSSMDCFCSSSSWGEGFPNVIGEAMACRVPVVATDVGDSAEIVGDAGAVVPPEDPEALADGLRRVLQSSEAARLGTAARHRIEMRFSPEALVSETLAAVRRRTGIEFGQRTVSGAVDQR